MAFATRLVRAARLEPLLYEEVEADRSATLQSLLVVVLASVAGGIWLGAGLVQAAVVSIAAWFLWALVTYVIGAKVLPESQTEADLGQMLRVIGFASAPGILRVFGVGLLAYPVALLTGVWMLVAMVVGIRQALDYRSTGRAVVVALIGWLVYVAIIFWLISGSIGSAAPPEPGSVRV